MYFSAVELPQDLIQAHREGQLVIFVGAGASRDEPSGLPDFPTLARDVAAAAHVTELDLEQNPDSLLGRLAQAGIPVNQLVAERLAGGEPNVLHKAIVSLAAAGPSTRIVTTNYDRHLSAAFAEAHSEIEEYRAPALPMGDDFDGLVYLHGSLDQDPRHLVVTDIDFGRAYLRDAWAARFLERMYSTYTVLFVGYSVSDMVMRYLAMSLSNAQPRFLLTHAPSNVDWRRLDVEPIGYEADGDDHSHLADVIKEWSTEASRGLLDHEQRVRELASAPPSGIPDEESYLEATLADPVRHRFFTKFADHPEWLTWVQHRTPFPTLFDAQARLDPAALGLANWFVDRFVLDKDRTNDALDAVRGAGGSLSPDLWWALGRGLKQASPRPGWLGPWLILIVEQAPPGRPEWLEYILADAELPAERALAILIFDHLTQPRGAVEPSGLLGTRIEVGIPGGDHWLREAWQQRLRPELDDIAPDILAIVDRHLRRARNLLVVTAGDKGTFDPLHSRRAAIHEHPQDSHPEPIDVLIDAARDSIEAALDAGIDVAHGHLESWIGSGVPLLRRLAIHGWGYRADVSSADKLNWLLQHGGLFDHELKTEIHHLLRQVVSNLDESGSARLVDAVRNGPELEDEELADRSRYDVLQWVLKTRPDLPGAGELLDQIQARHPSWQVDPHPGLRSWSETGVLQPRPPMSVEELHGRIVADPAAALSELQPYREVTFSITEPDWDDALSLISSTVSQHPDDGIQLIKLDLSSEVRAAVVRGWSRSELTDERASEVLDQLLELTESRTATLVRELTELLTAGGKREGHSTKWWQFAAARELASRLWDRVDPVDEGEPTEDWLGRAINHPAGKLAQFWLDALISDWQAAPDTWNGLPPALTEPLELMLSAGDIRTQLAQPVLASRIRLLHGADPGWTERHILPLLSWEVPDRAARTWHGYLYWGRPTRQLLEAGLLDAYIETASNADSLSSELHRQLAGHLAGIATSPSPSPQDWVTRFVAAADEDLRVMWASAIARMLKDLPDEEVAAQWQGWLKPYWRDRLSGVPRVLDVREASAMAGWVPHLGPAFAEAVTLVTRWPARLDQPLLLRDLETAAATSSHAGPIAELLAHLLRDTETLWDCETLHRIVDRVRAGASPAHLTAIREHALRLACADAAEW